MVTQKQAVINAVLQVIPTFELGGEVILKSLLTTENKKEMRAILFQAFKAREVNYSKEDSNLDDDVYLTKYVSSLLDNWVRKLKDFNSGEEYKTKNPGSRAGSQDDQIKSLRGLLKLHADNPESVAKIKEAITARLAVIKPAAKAIEINVDALPEDLKYLVD